MAKPSFAERLKSGVPLVSDGATGTNLQARGLRRGLPSEAWMFEHPEQIEQLHRDFVAAGSDIILTNTFGGSPLRLREAGLDGKVQEVNQMAISLARQAAGEKAYVAGSIGPSGGLLKPLGPLEEAEVFASFAEQAQVMAETGVDLIVIETQFDLGEATLAVKAVRSVTSLPLVCSFSYDRGTRTMMGVKPSQMARVYADLGVDVLGINCGRSLDENFKALQELRSATSLPIWFKPNAGLPKLDADDNPTYDVTPEAMGALAAQWLEAGAQVVGGCCGTTPEHLGSIASAVKSR